MESVQYYSNTGFDRAPHMREGRNGATLYHAVCLWQGKFFFSTSGTPYITGTIVQLTAFTEFFFLGMEDDREIICLDLSRRKPEEILPWLGEGDFLDLRHVVHDIDRKEAAILAYAKALAEWNANHVFCGVCGSRTESRERGHHRICTDKTCAKIIYPRIDPAVIVLVEYRVGNDGPRCLLNRVKTGDSYRCSTFAGFVEVGESLENAVIREMKEEINVDVESMTYVSSQPWPFPSSVMIGFRATVSSPEFQVDNVEIKDAAWYSAKEIKELVASGKLELSRSDSIARFLIESWVADNLSL
ncbi:NAD(+) diphosphatase [Sinomicrobium pectinilyticum]|uniref:NAD(+) diphosphatase n=1 Tax=Sinomicrobium pectinilyticum TaxID=1084421 RepID=A0A3N0EXP4_SINP1|nr:NAD(+) diphosphatase [Sinomicrobium pectinilyticum]RNL92670.1 NAD(+) diphosphatase [Sinomicrobium pectinilyticum]